MNYQKHETAIIDEGVHIGDGTRIWHWVHVSKNASIGSKCSIGQGVFIGAGVEIGNNCKIQNNVSVYEGVKLEDDVFCGPSMVFTNVINPRSSVVRKSEYKNTLVRKGVSIGANATIVCGNEIGEYAFIAAGAVIISNVKAFALMAGVPGKQKGWMSRFGEKIPLPLTGQGEYRCPHTGDCYFLRDGQMFLEAN